MLPLYQKLFTPLQSTVPLQIICYCFQFLNSLYWFLIKMSFTNESNVKMYDSKYFETPQVLPKRRSSIFALDLKGNLVFLIFLNVSYIFFNPALSIEHEISIPGNLDAYNQKLQKEILEWKKLLKQKNDALKK